MDTGDPEITFNEEGVCSHCLEFRSMTSKQWYPNEEGQEKLASIYEKIKQDGRNKNYDCILGLSGGVDSSYLALKLFEAGINPLVVHVDGGWNSELAVQNIESIVNYCGWNLHTIVIDWEEMKALQIAYLKSGIANQDVPQDHVFFASLYHFAVKHGVNTVISGGNISTEAIFPKSWESDAMDSKSLRAIYKTFGNKKVKLKKYKTISFLQLYFYYPFIRKMRTIRPLNYMPYIKSEALQELKDKVGYKEYERKHGESIFTKFFQNYYQPTKFGYDKRKPHLSSLIVTGQISREAALRELDKSLYEKNELREDIDYICKKLDFSPEEFESIMNAKVHTYEDFPNNYGLYKKLKLLQKIVAKITGKKISVYS